MGDLNGSDDLPVVFTFTFGNDLQQSQFQSTHSRLLNMIFQRSNLRHASTAQQALSLFGEHEQPHAVFVTDPAIMLSRNEVVSQRLVQYASRGGIVVFGGIFGANVGAERLDTFFGRTWDVPWRAVENGLRTFRSMGTNSRDDYFCNYHGPFSVYTNKLINVTPMSLNHAAVEGELRSKLPVSYTGIETAQFLQGVERHDSWYVPQCALSTPEPAVNKEMHATTTTITTSSSSSSPAPTPMLPTSPGSAPVAHHLTATSIAFATFGDGRLGYVGDIDGDEATDAIVLAMMGLL